MGSFETRDRDNVSGRTSARKHCKKEQKKLHWWRDTTSFSSVSILWAELQDNDSVIIVTRWEEAE